MASLPCIGPFAVGLNQGDHFDCDLACADSSASACNDGLTCHCEEESGGDADGGGECGGDGGGSEGGGDGGGGDGGVESRSSHGGSSSHSSGLGSVVGMQWWFESQRSRATCHKTVTYRAFATRDADVGRHHPPPPVRLDDLILCQSIS